MSPIKVGFVGLSITGWAARTLAPSLMQSSLRESYDIVAVSTGSEESAQKSAAKYSKDIGHPIRAYYGDTSKIASDPDVDLVAIAVKTPFHKQLVMPVIEAKKDFFLEWPAGASLEETKAIAQAAQRQGVRSIIGLQGRHSTALRKVKELLASGIIGTVKSTNVLAHVGREFPCWAPTLSESAVYVAEKKNGATRLSVPIAHHLDQLTHVLGHFVSLSATDAILYPIGTFVDAEGKPTGKKIQSEISDHFSITGFLENGILVNIFWRAGYATGEGTGRRQFVWEIDGEEGTIRLESNKANGAFPSAFEPDLYLNGKKIVLDTVSGSPGTLIDSVTTAWKEFAKGKGNYATIDDAVKNHELLDAIELSAKEGRRVML